MKLSLSKVAIVLCVVAYLASMGQFVDALRIPKTLLWVVNMVFVLCIVGLSGIGLCTAWGRYRPRK